MSDRSRDTEDQRLTLTGEPYVPGRAMGTLVRRTASDQSNAVLVISPEEIELISQDPVGLIVVDAAPFSHAMIALLGKGIPTVLVTQAQAPMLEHGTRVSIDGATGVIAAPPDTSHALSELPEAPGRHAHTKDGVGIKLLASVRAPGAATRARQLGAEGIGLVRSEFLQPENGTEPGLDFYRRAFQALIEAASPLPVTIRLLDIAADKRPAWLPGDENTHTTTGLQGIRLFDRRPVDRVVDAQVAAVAELADDADLSILLPFITRVEEFEFWRSRFSARLPGHVGIGVMAETVASVLDIDRLLDTADFVAIGCNDLMQAVFSADRDQPALRDYLDPYAPVLLNLFAHVAQLAGSRLSRVQLCGLLPQVRGLMPVLVGMGYRRFSVDTPFIPHLARELAAKPLTTCETLARAACKAGTTREVLALLDLPQDRPLPFRI